MILSITFSINITPIIILTQLFLSLHVIKVAK